MSFELQRTFILTGLPRSGTTYLAAVLYNPPSVITLSEAGGAWRRFYREYGRSEKVLDLCADFRRRVEAGEPMMSFDNTPGYEGSARVDTWNQKKTEQRIPAAPGFRLGLKNPEVFLELLPIFLAAGLKCVISVRHPARIINSWVKRARGRVERRRSSEGSFAEGQCVSFQSHVADPVQRRIELHNYLAGLIVAQQDHPGVMLVRHEDWSAAQLDRVCEFLGLECPGRLQPPVIAPEAITLPPEECQRIAAECMIAGAFGFPIQRGRLADVDEVHAGATL